MDSVVAGRVKYPLERAQFTDQFRVKPELID